MKNKSIIIVISVILVLTAVGAGFWVFENKEKNINKEVSQKETATQENDQEQNKFEIEKIDISNWQTYRNEEYGFEFKYPIKWIKKEDGIKSTSGGEYNVSVIDSKKKDNLISSFYDEDIVVKYFSGIDIKNKNIDKRIKNLDDYVGADFPIVDLGCLYGKEKIGSLGEVYVVELGGNYGHYALMFEVDGKIYEIIFGREKTFGENCKNKEFKILDFLNKEEIEIINSFKIIK